MKYIIDTDSLKECLKLLYVPFTNKERACVYLDDVFSMIDAFPKEEVKKNETVLR